MWPNPQFPEKLNEKLHSFAVQLPETHSESCQTPKKEVFWKIQFLLNSKYASAWTFFRNVDGYTEGVVRKYFHRNIALINDKNFHFFVHFTG